MGSMMNRRGFLSALGVALAGATLDPERALWVPGAKLISIPPPTRFVSGASVMAAWRKELERDANDFDFRMMAACGVRIRIGDTIYVRRPLRFIPYVPEPLRDRGVLATRIA
jgi:hypothetical protein